jgi:hypothetical protein
MPMDVWRNREFCLVRSDVVSEERILLTRLASDDIIARLSLFSSYVLFLRVVPTRTIRIFRIDDSSLSDTIGSQRHNSKCKSSNLCKRNIDIILTKTDSLSPENYCIKCPISC